MNLFKETIDLHDDLESNQIEGDILSMFKIGNQIKDNYEAINGLTYVETLNLEHIYTRYLHVFEFAGETILPEALSQQ